MANDAEQHKLLRTIFADPSIANATNAKMKYSELAKTITTNENEDSQNFSDIDVSVQSDGVAGSPPFVDKRAEFLEKREREVDERETILDERERQLTSWEETQGATRLNNWPFEWYGIDFHDIAKDIPLEHQRLCRRAYHMWFLTCFALTWNFASVILVMSLTKNVVVAPMEHVLWAAIYMLIGTIVSWTGWYKGLYCALANSRSVVWLKFWFVFGLHGLYVVYSIVGLPNWSTSGVLNFISVLGPGGSWIVAFFCAINICAWSFIAVLTSIVGREARQVYYTKGGNDQMRADARSMVVAEIAQGV